MTPVILESPYAGDVDASLTYLRACMRDCLLRDEAPYASHASHALYTQPGVLDDTVLAERDRGIAAGFAWRALCRKTVIYLDRGWSSGMLAGYHHAVQAGHEIAFRSLHGDERARELYAGAALGDVLVIDETEDQR